MTQAKIIKLRPAVLDRPVPRVARPARPPYGEDGPVSVEWEEGRGLYVVVCNRCMEWLYTERFEQAHGWADEHHCDPELATLLAEVLGRRAA
ncbi:hypothetical protein GCM10027176_31290 [Actinoallomurus bryophytorum]|uniref:Uncharacterized protein n=1 Tax=Actinoallomurus bryophytorum TaxID=1490222 RepID=A0A543CG15_9ACTN|nr:hypothetical protein [Actinoallomurus bryophytorum]TQL96018.1 hypothetical protein FB559_1535 [Actinoallomurus bryophytorum]